MPLQATIIVVDNSEQSRNGDYLPNRFEAQSDAVSLIFNGVTSDNPESSVGLMSCGGQPEVLTTLTTEFGRIIDGLHRTKIRGESRFATALNVAALALKHRQNKSQHQRVIIFTCSPISSTKAELDKLAKRLKKTSLNVDVIAFGDLDPDNIQKLESFNENIKGPADADHQSHLVVMPPGPNLLSDSLLSTPILGGQGGQRGAGAETDGAQGGDGGFGMGVDPNMDPELELAIRMSLEEEQRRAEREEREKADKEGKSELEPVPEGEEKGEGSSSGPGDKKDPGGADGKGGDRMDTS